MTPERMAPTPQALCMGNLIDVEFPEGKLVDDPLFILVTSLVAGHPGSNVERVPKLCTAVNENVSRSGSKIFAVV
jgi:hypothetical protein